MIAIKAPTIVGRDKEIARIREAIEESQKGTGHAIFVIGEAGSGKSRIAREIADDAARSGVRVLRGRASSIGSATPLRPLTQALLALARDRDRVVDQLGPYRALLGRLIPDWQVEPAVMDTSSVLLAEGVLRLLGLVAQPQGVVLVLEDLHLADAETLAVLEHLLDNLRHGRIAVLCTLRPEPGAQLDLMDELAQVDGVTRVELAGLSTTEVAELAAACLGCQLDQLPHGLAERLHSDSAGNPFLVEGLLHGTVSGGGLTRTAAGWALVTAPTVLPAAVARSVRERAERLGPLGAAVLRTAAVLGERFPLALVGTLVGASGPAHGDLGRAAATANLLVGDDDHPGWYSFVQPVSARALRAQLATAEQAELARRAADMIERNQPDYDGEWCPLIARLRLAAGQRSDAANLFALAGRRALTSGQARSAVGLLGKALQLIDREPVAAQVKAETMEALIDALGAAGLFERAFELTDAVAALGNAGLTSDRQAALHLALARTAKLAGWWVEGLAQVDAARQLLGPFPAPARNAQLEAISAHLSLDAPGADRVRTAERLALRAIKVSEQAQLPSVACMAWRALGMVRVEAGPAAANECLSHVVRLAEDHQLPMERLSALVRIACNTWLAEGDVTRLTDVLRETHRLDAMVLSSEVQGILGLDAVLRGEFDRADGFIDDACQRVAQINVIGLDCYLHTVRAIGAAHRGDRPAMHAALGQAMSRGGPHPRDMSLALGLANSVCAMLEEDHEQARQDLDAMRAAERANPTTSYLNGQHGLWLLLGVLAGDLGEVEHQRVAESMPGRFRWNRQFVRLAGAVLLGRRGQVLAANEAAASAIQDAAPYPLAGHLGLRLVAVDAHEHRWGEPVRWLRQAEDHFADTGVRAVADACRRLQRQLGATVRQRRRAAVRVPREFQESGITVREYEVLRLLAHRMSNKTIGAQLHISPRTVEKHVANLLVKTGNADRTALYDHPVGTG